MDINLSRFKKIINIKDIPFLFERYEFFIILIGTLLVFLLGGFVFYKKAYKAVEIIPEVRVEVMRVNSYLFEKTIEELRQRKQMTPDLPIIDPFQ